MAVKPVGYAIDLPFDFSSGKTLKIVSTTDPKYWRNKVLSLLNTNNNERVWYPVFGASLADIALFENSQDAIDMATNAISETFIRWLPELKFLALDASYDSTTGSLSLTVKYRIPSGDDDYAKLSIGSASSYGGTASVIWNG